MHKSSRYHDNQHISCVVLPKVENSVILGTSTGQTGWPTPSNETSGNRTTLNRAVIINKK